MEFEAARIVLEEGAKAYLGFADVAASNGKSRLRAGIISLFLYRIRDFSEEFPQGGALIRIDRGGDQRAQRRRVEIASRVAGEKCIDIVVALNRGQGFRNEKSDRECSTVGYKRHRTIEICRPIAALP